jgi:hypothetical protein
LLPVFLSTDRDVILELFPIPDKGYMVAVPSNQFGSQVQAQVQAVSVKFACVLARKTLINFLSISEDGKSTSGIGRLRVEK